MSEEETYLDDCVVQNLTVRGNSAYHEAGHAVVMNHYGIKIYYVTIKPTDRYLGFIRHAPVGFRRSRQYLRGGKVNPNYRVKAEEHMIATLAGGIASQTIFGTTEDDLYVKGMLMMELNASSDTEVDAYTHWLYCRADRIIRRYWNAVEAVARQLMVSERLTGADVDETIQAAMRKKGPPFDVRAGMTLNELSEFYNVPLEG